jgi:hypothetical protein
MGNSQTSTLPGFSRKSQDQSEDFKDFFQLPFFAPPELLQGRVRAQAMRLISQIRWAVAALALLGGSALGQKSKTLDEYFHTAWTIDDGAPASAQVMAQTADGFLWFGTPTGLFRFDGAHFDHYESTHHASNLEIFSRARGTPRDSCADPQPPPAKYLSASRRRIRGGYIGG